MDLVSIVDDQDFQMLTNLDGTSPPALVMTIKIVFQMF